MKLRLLLFLLFITISGLNLCGCSALQQSRKREDLPEVRLERALLARAVEYEHQGRYHQALQAYETAAAIIVAKKNGLETFLRKEAEGHYQLGLKLRDQRKYTAARHEFLVALRYWPDFPEVVELLKPAQPKPYTHYVVHKVQEGEFLTAIAEKYYQDQSKFKIIAQFNNLKDATKLYVGMKLKIPEIEGVTFRPTEEQQETEVAAGENGIDKAAEEVDSGTGDEGPLIASGEKMDYDQAAIYQEEGVSLLEEGQYLAALHEFQKVLNLDPSSKQIREYMALTHYRQGEVLFGHAEYLEARHHFQQALSFDENWTVCKEYLKRAEDAYKETHYRRGIQYFEEEKLKEAIEQWQLVGELDPDYKQVPSYLLRAQKLLEKVQELKEVP